MLEPHTPRVPGDGEHTERSMAFDKLEHVLRYLIHRPEVSADTLLVIIEAQKRVVLD